jgi:hypothetical protein
MSALARVAAAAAADSELWRGALLPRPRAGDRFAPRLPGHLADGVEAVHEGYLLHYGAARAFSGEDRHVALLTGDHLYAAGLAAICRAGDLAAVAELADLISRCARDRGEGLGEGDEAHWESATARLERLPPR